MGLTTAKVRIFSPDRQRARAVELLVDTGSTYSWIDGKILEELGIGTRATWKFRSIDGRMIDRKIGDAYMECLGEMGPSVVVFGEKDDGQVLGLHALEGLRLEVAPSTGELRKAEAGLALISQPQIVADKSSKSDEEDELWSRGPEFHRALRSILNSPNPWARFSSDTPVSVSLIG